MSSVIPVEADIWISWVIRFCWPYQAPIPTGLSIRVVAEEDIYKGLASYHTLSVTAFISTFTILFTLDAVTAFPIKSKTLALDVTSAEGFEEETAKFDPPTVTVTAFPMAVAVTPLPTKSKLSTPTVNAFPSSFTATLPPKLKLSDVACVSSPVVSL